MGCYDKDQMKSKRRATSAGYDWICNETEPKNKQKHTELARLLTNYNTLLITVYIKKTVVSNIILIICNAM